MEKYWNHVIRGGQRFDVWEKGKMQIMFNSFTVCICPSEKCEDYFDLTDMMTAEIFSWTLLGIVLDIRQGRQIVWDNFDRDEALWFLGWLGIAPTYESNEQLRKHIEKTAKEGWKDGC